MDDKFLMTLGQIAGIGGISVGTLERMRPFVQLRFCLVTSGDDHLPHPVREVISKLERERPTTSTVRSRSLAHSRKATTFTLRELISNRSMRHTPNFQMR